MAFTQPKTNWDTHPKAIEPADLNRIEGNILAVREQSDLPFKLEIVSALPSAAGNQGRAVFYNGRAYICDGTKWTDISGSIGDATAANVLSGKVFSSQSAGVGITGAMPNHGAHNITPGKTAITIPEGYHSGSGQVASLGGNAAAANVLTGKTFSSDIVGRGASGSMPNKTGHVTAQGSSVSGTTLRLQPQKGYYPGDSENSVQLSDENFIAENLKSGKNIFGKDGTLSPGGFVKNVQYGTASMANGVNSLNVTITAVDRPKSYLVFSYTNSLADGVPPSGDRTWKTLGRLSSNTNINFSRANLSGTNDINYISWFVVEFEAGLRVQYGYSTIVYGTTETNITITAVDRSKTFVIITEHAQEFEVYPSKTRHQAILTSDTNLQLKRLAGDTHTDANHYVAWQVIEFL